MRLRPWIWIVLCLLLATGAWLLWPHGHHPSINTRTRPSALPTAAGPAVARARPLTILSTNNVQAAAAATAKANQFRCRLSNTTKTLGELVNDRHAILLANALIDTSAKLNLSIPKKLQASGEPGAYIVQANGPINNAFRAMLAASGAQIVSYIPNNAYLVTLSAANANALAGNPMTQAVIPYEPYYKVSASLMPWIGQTLPAGATLNVELFPGSGQTAIQAIAAAGGKVLSQEESPNGLIVNVQPPADWTVVPALPGVHIVEPSHRRVPANDLSRATVGVAIDTQVSSNYLGLTGKNVLVEVNDSGIDATHPDFTQGGNRVFGDAPQSLVDTNGHGTHVAGTIAGNGYESTTVTNAQGSMLTNIVNGVPSGSPGQFRGMAPLATLFSVGGVNGGSDTNFITDQYLQEAPALTNALISNNSWNYGGDNAYDLEAASYDAAVRDALPLVTGSQPVLFVFSAGNEGNGDDTTDPGNGTADSIDSPATAKNVITVGAIQEFRNITNEVTNADGTIGEPWQAQTSTSYRIAGFSSRGNVGINTEGTYGRFKPDVVAPGTSIVSTRSSQWDINTYFYASPTNYNVHDLSVIIPADALSPASFPYVPTNSVQVSIQLVPNGDSPSPFPFLPIYVGLLSSPGWDFVTTNNAVFIPGSPEAPAGYLQSIFSSEFGYGFDYGISNSSSEPINLDIIQEIVTTNNPGNYFLVYSNLDQSIGTVNPSSTGPGPYYRYETGTSMAAADASGVLALMQDYFTNALQTVPSPALLKAMLIAGARLSNPNVYNLQDNNSINYEGWGLINLPNSLPPGVTNLQSLPPSASCSEFFVDQSPTNALATGDSHTYIVTVSTNAQQASLPLRVTLAWTDPPGDPAAAIKLVNGLSLVVSNGDTSFGPVLFYGNDIQSGIFNAPELTNTPAVVDAINNVENVFISPPLGTTYTITVSGRDVNVNAVTAQTNNAAGAYAPNVVQDFALVVACGEGEVTNAIQSVVDNPIVSNPTTDQQISFLGGTNVNAALLNQFAGASSPLLGTNTTPVGTPTVLNTNGVAVPSGLPYAANAIVTLGQTNQWHFYVITNPVGGAAEITNAAFVTFLPDTLSIPRMGVFADSTANATTPEADIDLYVTTDSTLTNLNPAAISNCVYGTQVGLSAGGVFNGASLSRGGTEFVVDIGSTPGQVYYVGVYSERQVAAEYDFLSVFTSTPFSTMPNGNQVVNGQLLPVNIPDGSPAHPGIAYIFGLAIYPTTVGQVVVNDSIVHQNYGDLIGTLTHNGVRDVLNNHDELGNPPGPYNFIYDDFPNSTNRPSDGPGSLVNFIGTQGIGPWMLKEADTSITQTGYVAGYTLTLAPYQNPTKGITVTIQSGTWFYTYVDVPVGYTNLTISATNYTATATPPVQLYVKEGAEPTASNYDATVLLNNPGPLGLGGTISLGPPLTPGTYFIGVFNPGPGPQTVFIIATLAFSAAAISTVDYDSSGPVPILDDAVTYDSIFVPRTDIIQEFNVGLRVDHPRISDLVFHLIGPDGTRYLLMENRGAASTNGCGATLISTNVIPVSHNGGAQAVTNSFDTGFTSGSFTISYNMFTLPDRMDVYDGSGRIGGTPGLVSGTGTLNPIYTQGPIITIVMNAGGNTNYPTTAWTYTVTSTQAKYYYLTFTEDTNLTTTPIKFAPPPFVPNISAGVGFTNGFEGLTATDYFAGQTFGPWTVISNQVSVVTDPTNAYEGSNYLALASGVISNNLPTVAGQTYTLTFAYRGPGIISLWRGESNTVDSISGYNGTFLGDPRYATNGVVGQAFQITGNGSPSSRVIVPDNASFMLTNALTVEGWAWASNEPSGGGVFLMRGDDRFGLDPYQVYLDYGSQNLRFQVQQDNTAPGTSALYYNFASSFNQWVHLAGTWDGHSGVQRLYVNGAIVAQQVTSVIPLANLDPTASPGIGIGNNQGPVFYNAPWIGYLDEMSLYRRALSASEINAIYQKGSAGKYDPSLINASPAQSLAEAAIAVNGANSTILNGNNTNWQIYTATFVATQDGTPLQIAGLEPGMLLDDFTLTATPANLYYQPEQDMSALNGTSAYGEWQLEIQDDRAGAGLTNTLLSWQLEFTFANTNVPSTTPPITILPPGQPISGTNGDPAGVTNSINWYQVNVPANAIAATNLLLYAAAPESFLYSFNYPPTTNQPGDAVLIANQIAPPTVAAVLTEATSPALVPGAPYYLGVDGPVGTPFTIEVDFATPEATILNGSQPQTNVVTAGAIDYYSITVPTNADFATNILLFATGPVNLLFNQNTLPTGSGLGDYTLLAGATNGVSGLSAGSTPPLAPGQTYFLGVQNTSASNITFGIEVDFDLLLPSVASNSITWTLINVPTNADFATNLLLFASAPLNIWWSTNNPPTITNTGDFDMIPGATNGAYVLGTTGTPNIVPGGSYWLGVQNTNSFDVSYDVQVNFRLLPTVAPSSITWTLINVPTNADFATNLLLFASAPLNVWWSTNNPPTITNANDFDMIPGATNGAYVLGTTGTPDIVPGGSYWLGVQNTNSFAVNYDVQVNFRLLLTVASNSITWSLINVPTNADFATNLLLFASAPVNVWWSTNNPPTITNLNDFDMIPGATNGACVLGTTGTPDIVPGGSYWLGVQNTNGFAVSYDVQVNFRLLPTVASNSVAWELINVPTNADFATNLLFFATAPVNVWWSTNNPPTITNLNDVLLLPDATYPSGTNGLAVLGTNSAPAFIVPGGSYWLGVQNTNSFAVSYDVLVNFHLLTSTNASTNAIFISSIVATNLGGKPGFLLTWFAPSNDLFLVQWTPSLVPVSWNTFTNIIAYNTNAFTSPTHTQFNFFDDGSQTGGFDPTRFYRLILLQAGLTNGVPQTNSAPAGSFDYFLVAVPTNADLATNLLLSATGPLNVWFNQTTPPTGTNAGDYLLLAGATNGSSILSTTSAPTNIVPGGTYWLGVQNTNSFAVTFSLEVNFHLLTSTPVISISSILYTNVGGKPGFLLAWLAPTNDVFQVQWTGALLPVNWQFFTNFIDYTGPPTPTNGWFSFFDDGSQTPPGLPPMRFYRIVLVGSIPSTHTNAVSISSLTWTNLAGTNSFWLKWSAPTNYLFEVQWTTNLVPVLTWHTFPNIIAYSTFVSPTNSLFNLFDNGSQGGLGPMKFYRLILLP